MGKAAVPDPLVIPVPIKAPLTVFSWTSMTMLGEYWEILTVISVPASPVFGLSEATGS
jgi:hypothetical protein